MKESVHIYISVYISLHSVKAIANIRESSNSKNDIDRDMNTGCYNVSQKKCGEILRIENETEQNNMLIRRYDALIFIPAEAEYSPNCSF